MARFDFCRIRVAEHLAQDRRIDLPGQPVLVLQPAALPFLPALGELLQNVSTSSCVLQSTENEIASVNLKWGPPFKRDEFLPVELEPDGHRAAFRPWPCVSVASDLEDLRVLKIDT